MVPEGISGTFRAKDLTCSGKQKYGIPSKTIIKPTADRNRFITWTVC